MKLEIKKTSRNLGASVWRPVFRDGDAGSFFHIVTGSRDAFQHIGKGKEDRSDGTTADQPKREWGPQALLPPREHGRWFGHRGWFRDMLHTMPFPFMRLLNSTRRYCYLP